MFTYRTLLVGLALVAGGACDGVEKDPMGESEVSAEVSTPSFAFSALQLSGSQVARSATLVSTLTDKLSLEAWIRPDAGGPALQAIAFNGNGSSNGYGLYLNSGALSVVVPGAGTVTCSTCRPGLGVWTHVAVVVNNGMWQFYVNGTLMSFSTTNLSVRRPTGGLSIGATMTGADGFKGAIDEVRLWNTVLAGPTIDSQMNVALLGNETGLAAYYRFDEGAGSSSVDATLFGHTLTLAGSPIWISSGAAITTGIARYALQMSGDAALSASAVATTATDNLTLEAWVRWDGGTAAQAVIYNGDTSSNGYGLYLDNGTPRVFVGGAGWVTCTTCKLTAGRFTHLAAVRAAGSWQIYQDGSAGSVDTIGPAPVTPSGVLSLASNSLGGEGLIGAIDDVRIWNVARSPQQIAQNATVSLTGYETGLVQYFRIDEGNGTAVHDVQGTMITPLNVIVSAGSPVWVTSGAGLATAQLSGR